VGSWCWWGFVLGGLLVGASAAVLLLRFL